MEARARGEEGATGSAAADGVQLRRLATHEEFAEAVALQRATWGESFRDVVPAALLKVTQRIGGVAAGAFGADGSLLGFVYGLPGLLDGACVHWSHMLAVRPEARNCGIGQRLKEYQRELLVDAGIEWMYWTFDPLVARNGHFNLNRLGVEIREYVPDMYGNTGSELHAFGTDRFVVAWRINGGRAASPALVNDTAGTPILNEASDTVLAQLDHATIPVVRVEIPLDIESVSLERARQWRRSTRRGFLAALSRGYRVRHFDLSADRAFYVLT